MPVATPHGNELSVTKSDSFHMLGMHCLSACRCEPTKIRPAMLNEPFCREILHILVAIRNSGRTNRTLPTVIAAIRNLNDRFICLKRYCRHAQTTISRDDNFEERKKNSFSSAGHAMERRFAGHTPVPGHRRKSPLLRSMRPM